MSCFDDKRYVSDDGVNTLAYFLNDIKNWYKIHRVDKIDEIDEIFRSDKVNKKLRIDEFLEVIKD